MKQFKHLKNSIRYSIMILALVAVTFGCARNVEHDTELAARVAVDFIRVAFIEDNLSQAYELMAPAGRRYIPVDTEKSAKGLALTPKQAESLLVLQDNEMKSRDTYQGTGL